MAVRRVVVTGLGAITPIGLDVNTYWQNLLAGTSGADYITLFDATHFRTRFACELKGFKAENYVDKKEARKMDPFSHYIIAAADEAVRDSGVNFDKVDRTRVGVVMGSGIGGLRTFTDEIRDFVVGYEQRRGSYDGTGPKLEPRFNPFFIPKMIIDIAPGHVSMKYGIRGPNYSCVSACATGTNSIIDGYMLVKMGLVDMVLAGGGEAAVNEAGVGGFSAMKALSERNDDPKTASRPFDKDRDGFVLGEGAGCIILEEYEHALKRDAKMYAELAGIALSSDAYHMTAPDPDGVGVVQLMTNLVGYAGLKVTDVDYINMHGTSTPLGDIAETKAIKKVFGDHAYKMSVSSTKSMTGHLLGAAGAIEAIATILALRDNMVPPTINHFTDDPECDLNYTFNKSVSRELNVAFSNTFGFGGHNASVLFQKIQS